MDMMRYYQELRMHHEYIAIPQKGQSKVWLTLHRKGAKRGRICSSQHALRGYSHDTYPMVIDHCLLDNSAFSSMIFSI